MEPNKSVEEEQQGESELDRLLGGLDVTEEPEVESASNQPKPQEPRPAEEPKFVSVEEMQRRVEAAREAGRQEAGRPTEQSSQQLTPEQQQQAQYANLRNAAKAKLAKKFGAEADEVADTIMGVAQAISNMTVQPILDNVYRSDAERKITELRSMYGEDFDKIKVEAQKIIATEPAIKPETAFELARHRLGQTVKDGEEVSRENERQKAFLPDTSVSTSSHRPIASKGKQNEVTPTQALDILLKNARRLPGSEAAAAEFGL